MSDSYSCPEDLLRAIRSDANRCIYSLFGDSKVTVTGIMRVWLLFPGLWAMILYRLTHHFYYHFKPRALGKALYAPMFVISHLSGIVLGIEITPHARIGYGFFVNHFGGIHIAEVGIGENCNISHGVTIGNSSRVADTTLSAGPQTLDSPTLGDRVWVGPGATIAGPITIGHDSVVAANSLVTRDVSPFSVVMGVPAAAVSHRGSFTQVTYSGMTEDLNRSTALAAQAAQRATRGRHSAQPNSPARP
jgi:serine O-acetyltransferase